MKKIAGVEKPVREYFRDLFKDFYEKNTNLKFDDLNPFQRSVWMSKFYVSEVLRILSPGLVPDDEQDLDDCIPDGPSDAAVDFIYRSDDHVIIIQSKYRKPGKDEDEGEFDKFHQVLTKIHPKSSDRYKVNERVRAIASDIDWENDSFELHFITLGKPTANMIGLESETSFPHPYENLQDRVDFILYDEPKLNELIREARSTTQFIAKPIELLMNQSENEVPWIIYKNSINRKSYTGFIKTGQLSNLWKQHKNKLFTLNIRNYVGDTRTNKGIIETALKEPDNFYFFNNGISAVSTKIVPDIDKAVLCCHNFSIINGDQTIRSLAKAHIKNSVIAKNATVSIRIAEVDIKTNKEETEFIKELTRFNNTQNSIKIADFRSNDTVQRSLTKEFSELYRGGKKFKYKNKRDAESTSHIISINMEEFAKTIHAFRMGPIDCHGGISYLFDLKKGYPEVFGDGKNPWEILKKEDFNILAGTWFLCEYIRSQIQGTKEKLVNNINENTNLSSTDLNMHINAIKLGLERRWLIFYTVGEILREKYQKEKLNLNLHLAKFEKLKWLENPDKQPAKNLNRLIRASCEILVKLYMNAQKDPAYTHRNWTRSDGTLKSIQNEILYSSALINTLPILTE